ncbi:MAG TPA: hypothetical protein PLS00_12640, partial [Niabella sp.]|nr:hypothetical protein [Niabella sp.]
QVTQTVRVLTQSYQLTCVQRIKFFLYEEINVSKQKQSGDLYRVKHKKGTHLGSSQDTPGAFRGTLFDNENKLVGHAELEKVDESEYGYDYSYDDPRNQQEVELSPEMQKIAQAMGELFAAATMYVFTEYVAPPVKHWWQNEAVPTIKKKWQTLTDKTKDKLSPKGKKKSKLHTNEIVIASETFQGMFSHELKEAYEKYMNDMTSEEAQRELLDIFILSTLLIKKIRKLSNARIIKNKGALGEYLEGQKILESLTTPEYIGSINQILENNPQLMGEKTVYLSELLGRNLVLNGQYVPIEIGKFRDAIALQVDVGDDV